MNRKISAVYKITNTITGDFYIGSSKNVYQRWADHKCPSVWKRRPNNPMYQDMHKYGVDKFTFQVLGSVIPEYLKQVEQGLIEALQPTYNKIWAKGLDAEKIKKSNKACVKTYRSRKCLYNGEELTLRTLSQRFKKQGIEHPFVEATKYLIKEK